MKNDVECRLVTEGDLERIMRWRMLPEIDKNMRTHPILTIEKQRDWYRSLQEENSQYHWVIWVKGTPIGVINIHEIGVRDGKKSCSTGIYIAEKGGSPGLFFELHWNLFDFVFSTLHLDEIHAEALLFNKTAVLLNRRLWPEISEQKDCYAYQITAGQWQEEKKKRTYRNIHYEWNEQQQEKEK